MARYRITAPALGFEGRSCGVLFVNGNALVDSEIDTERRALSYFKKAGYGVELLAPDGEPVLDDGGEAERPVDDLLGPDGTPVEPLDDDGTTPPMSTTTVEPRPPLPPDSANKPEWIAAAEIRGYTFEQADAMTKPDLMATLKAIDNPTGGEQA